MPRKISKKIDWWKYERKEIPWYEWIYEINELWQVRSYWKNWCRQNEIVDKPQRLLQPWRKKHKKTTYKAVITLFDWLKHKHFYVWRLVAWIFMWLDIKDKTKQVIHIDWNNMNCRKDNLYIWTVSDRAFNFNNPWVLFSNNDWNDWRINSKDGFKTSYFLLHKKVH